jgi:hypothetical protein
MGEKKVQVIKPSATLIHKLHTQGTDISDKWVTTLQNNKMAT